MNDTGGFNTLGTSNTSTVAASYYASTTNTASPSLPSNFDTKIYDTNNAVTTGTGWRFTAPVAGVYFINSYYAYNAATALYLQIYKNGVVYSTQH